MTIGVTPLKFGATGGVNCDVYNVLSKFQTTVQSKVFSVHNNHNQISTRHIVVSSETLTPSSTDHCNCNVRSHKISQYKNETKTKPLSCLLWLLNVYLYKAKDFVSRFLISVRAIPANDLFYENLLQKHKNLINVRLSMFEGFIG